MLLVLPENYTLDTGHKLNILWLFNICLHCVKSVGVHSFPAFVLNTERYSIYLVRMRENADQKNSEYGHFLCSACAQTVFLGYVFLSTCFKAFFLMAICFVSLFHRTRQLDISKVIY